MLVLGILIAIALISYATLSPPKGPLPRVAHPQILPHVIHVRDREALRMDARYRASKRVGR